MQVWRRRFEGRIEQLELIHEFVGQVAEELQLDQDDAFACRLTVDEAATNVFEHSYSGQPGALEVSIWREQSDICISVRNWGASFDPEGIAEPQLDLPLEQRPIGGLGVFLMRKFMDQVSFSFDPKEGNTVTMCRSIGSRTKD